MPPRRDEDVGFAATRKLIVAPPCPVGVEVSEIQSTSGLAVHEHSRLTAMVKAPSPPAGPMFREFEVSVTAHCAVVGAVTLVDDEEPQLARTRSIAAAAADRVSAARPVTSVIESTSAAPAALMSFDLDC
jgi:hypothetical protein